MSGDLVEWLRAILDEKERTATDRGRLAGDVWTAVEVSAGRWEVVGVGGTVADHLTEWEARHIADHDPASTLREVESKRRIISEYERYAAERRRMMGGWESSREVSPILIAIALLYADRPGYREEWRL